jgi:hypothetical protein
MLRVPEQERRAHQAFLRAEEVLHVFSSGAMRKAPSTKPRRPPTEPKNSSGGSKVAAFGRTLCLVAG